LFFICFGFVLGVFFIIGDNAAVGVPWLPIQPKLVLLFKLSNIFDVSIVVELKKLVVKFGMPHWM
jgi:hypothetical protein